MTSAELAEFVGRVRKLFRGEIDEEIFALAKVRIGGLRLPVCLAALDEYALLYGGSKGKFIPAKFFEFYAKRTVTEETASATTAERLKSKALSDALDRDAIEEDWRRIRQTCEQLDERTRSEIVAFLEAHRWNRFPIDVAEWSRVQILAVSDIATDRVVEGFRNLETGKLDLTEDPRSFWSRVGGGAIRFGDTPRSRPSLDPSLVSEGSGEAGNRLPRVPPVEDRFPVEETEIPF